MHLEKYDEALAAFNKALEIDPQYADAWNNKGFALNFLGRHDEAIKAFDMAIEIESGFEEAK